MSDKLSEMYKLDRAIGLVTVASPLIQNLALLDIDEYLTADSLAVSHKGYINYIPIVNNVRRCKYISIDTAKDNTQSCILSLKWMKVICDTLLIVLSNDSLIIYDAEVTEPLFTHRFKTSGNDQVSLDVIPVGSAVLGEYLCVGLSDGFVHLFKAIEGHEFDYIHRVKLEEFLLCDGVGKYLVVATRQNIFMWELRSCLFLHRETLNSERVDAVPSVMKTSSELVIIGYENGELGLYSPQRHKTLVKCEGHKAKITAADYSQMKLMVITSSLDRFIKVWQFNFTHSSISCIFSIETNYEICGAGFLNLRCTEFCVVKSNNISVDVFVKVEPEYD